MSRKPKLNVRISPELLAKVDAAASSPRVTKAEVVERALTEHFDPARDADRFLSLHRLLDREHRQLKRMDHVHRVGMEMFATFVRSYFAVTPPLPQSERADAIALAGRRFEGFLDTVAQNVREGGAVETVLQDVTGAAIDH